MATALFTEGVTATAATETLLVTETTTITDSQTKIVSETATIVVTTTDVKLADTTITTTDFSYQPAPTLKARLTVLATPDALPAYATEVCADWNQYTKACKCAGFETTTITVPGAPETVTVTAGEAVTTTVGTVSATLTETVFVTATALATEIDTIAVTDIATGTTTVTVSATTTVSATSTPTYVVPIACQAVGTSFRLVQTFPDTTVRWMNRGVNFITFDTFWTQNPTGPAAEALNWVLDNNGYLEFAAASQKDSVPYYETASTADTVQVFLKPRAQVEAGIAAGTMARVKACIGATTRVASMTAGKERKTMLSCGNRLYISSGMGFDVAPDCVLLKPGTS